MTYLAWWSKRGLDIPPQDNMPFCLWVKPGRESMDAVGRGWGKALRRDLEGLEGPRGIHHDRNLMDRRREDVGDWM